MSLLTLPLAFLSCPRRLRRLVLFSVAGVTLLMALATPLPAEARKEPQTPCQVIAVGISGGITPPAVPPNETRLIQRSLKNLHYPGLCAKYFSWFFPFRSAHWIQKQMRLGRSYSPVGEADDPPPRIILYGYSFGGSAVLRLARQLSRESIPVEMLVLIDNWGFGRKTVPGNVKAVANFYQRDSWIFRGSRKLRLEDEAATRIVGNFQISGVGHLGMPRNPTVSGFLVETVRALYAQSPEPAPTLPCGLH